MVHTHTHSNTLFPVHDWGAGDPRMQKTNADTKLSERATRWAANSQLAMAAMAMALHLWTPARRQKWWWANGKASADSVQECPNTRWISHLSRTEWKHIKDIKVNWGSSSVYWAVASLNHYVIMYIYIYMYVCRYIYIPTYIYIHTPVHI